MVKSSWVLFLFCMLFGGFAYQTPALATSQNCTAQPSLRDCMFCCQSGRTADEGYCLQDPQAADPTWLLQCFDAAQLVFYTCLANCFDKFWQVRPAIPL